MKVSSAYRLMCGSAVLAEGLDFPRREVVCLTSENPLLKFLAPIDAWSHYWSMLTNWMESYPHPEERLHSLQTAYYEMFLGPGAELSVYLHDWYPNQSPAEFLSGFQILLNGMDLTQSGHWRNGSDHLAVGFELLAHLSSTADPRISFLVQRCFRPWFPTFVERIKEQARSDFFRVLYHIAAEVNHEMETV